MRRRGAKKTSEEARINHQVMKNLERSGAVNYLSAGMFTQLARFANTPQHKDFMISCDAEPPKTRSELIAARLVYEFLVDHKLSLTKESLTSEIKSDAFSSKTTASLAPLFLPNNNEVIKQLIARQSQPRTLSIAAKASRNRTSYNNQDNNFDDDAEEDNFDEQQGSAHQSESRHSESRGSRATNSSRSNSRSKKSSKVSSSNASSNRRRVTRKSAYK